MITPRRTVRNCEADEPLFDVAPTITAPPERHWFVADRGGYCQACGLPKANRRHAEPAA